MHDLTTDNKRIVKLWFERFSAGDIDGALALMTPDATWRVPGKPESLPTAGVRDMKYMRRVFERTFERLEAGLHMNVLDIVAEGDRVTTEVDGQGDLRNGRKYRQQYHFFFQLRDGKVSAVREYYDTLHALDTWYRE